MNNGVPDATIIVASGTRADQVVINHNAGTTQKRAVAVATVDARGISLLAHMLSDPGLCVRYPVKVESVSDLSHNAAGIEFGECVKCSTAKGFSDRSAGEEDA
jgi:hypothetical protein